MITKGQTVEELWQAALQAQTPNPNKPLSPLAEKILKEKRRKNAIATMKYSKTEKGKKANRTKCHNYFAKHRVECKHRVHDYQARFKAAYGISLMSWNYWLRKLNKQECTESDIPEKYSRILNDWKTYGRYIIDVKS